MDIRRFNEVVAYRQKRITKVLASKGDEYASEDRLHNFKIAGRMDDCSPKKAAWGMALKHLVSVLDMINDVRPFDYAMVYEKIGDMINYLILIEALLIEEIENDAEKISDKSCE